MLDGSEKPRHSTFTYINFEPKFIEEYLERVAPSDPPCGILSAIRTRRLFTTGW